MFASLSPTVVLAILNETESEGPLSETLRNALEGAKHMTRHFPHIAPESGPLEATMYNLLLEHERAPKWAAAVAHDELAAIVAGLSREEARVFTRRMALSDLMRSIEDGTYAGRTDYPLPVSARLGETCAAAALFTGHAKIDGRVVLRF